MYLFPRFRVLGAVGLVLLFLIGINSYVSQAGYAGFSDRNNVPVFGHNIEGSSLFQENSTQGWSADGSGGCLISSFPSVVYNVDIQLPQGARIDYLRIYYYDSSPTNANGWVTTYDGAGHYTDIAFVTSANAAGYGTNLSSGPIGHTVDNHNNAYVLNWRPNSIGSSQMLCGFRVAYYPVGETTFYRYLFVAGSALRPRSHISSVFLPMITR